MWKEGRKVFRVERLIDIKYIMYKDFGGFGEGKRNLRDRAWRVID